MATQDNDITWQIVLQHMQAMEQRIMGEIGIVKAEIGIVKSDLRRVGSKVELVLVQTGNIDERLDDIEVFQIPKLKKAVGMK